MLSTRKSANFLPVGKDFTIRARYFLPAGNGLRSSPAEVTKRHDGLGRRTPLWQGRLNPQVDCFRVSGYFLRLPAGSEEPFGPSATVRTWSSPVAQVDPMHDKKAWTSAVRAQLRSTWSENRRRLAVPRESPVPCAPSHAPAVPCAGIPKLLS